MPIMAIVAKGHPLAKMKTVSVEQCAQFKLLLQLDNDVTSWMFSLELGALERHARALVSSNNQMMLKPLILSGAGVAFYTPMGFYEELKTGDVLALPISGVRNEAARLGVIVPRTRKLPTPRKSWRDISRTVWQSSQRRSRRSSPAEVQAALSCVSTRAAKAECVAGSVKARFGGITFDQTGFPVRRPTRCLTAATSG